MSFKLPKDNYYAGYREKLDYEQQIMQQLSVCLEAFNSGDRRLIINAVDAFELIITPDIVDQIYKDETKIVLDNWKKEYDKRMIKYNAECEKAMCPDVIDKPSIKSPIDIFKTRFQIVLALFSRANLLLQKEDNEKA